MLTGWWAADKALGQPGDPTPCPRGRTPGVPRPTGQRVCVLAPSPLLTVTVEAAGDRERDEIHLHAGGQGLWIARMLVRLGVEAVMCGTFGGESGAVLATLIANEGITVRSVAAEGSNGAYLHDRRSGERVEVAAMPAAALTRHELDELYGLVLVEALDAGVCVLGGPSDDVVLPEDTYRRLAADLRRNGRTVVADLAGGRQAAALSGGVTVLKVSHEELLADERITDDEPGAIVAAMRLLAGEGADHVVVTRADEPTFALLEGELLQAVAPPLEPSDTHGAGDSVTAGIAAGLAQGLDLRAALRLGVAAGAVNVTRRGLATGTWEEITRMAEHVEVRPLADPSTEESRCAP